MTAIGKGFIATLSTRQRGPVLTRRAASKADAYAEAHELLDQAERREWNRGETVSVNISQAEE